MVKTSRGFVKDYISFDEETLRASSMPSSAIASVNRYISRRCMGAPHLRTSEMLDEISRYIQSQVEPDATREAREFVAKNMRGRKDNEKIDAYTKRKGDYKMEKGKKLISDIKEEPIEDFLSDVGDFIIAGSSKAQQPSIANQIG